MLRFRFLVSGVGRNHDRVRICLRGPGTARISKSQPTHPAQSSRTLLSVRKRMKPSRGPFPAIGWYLFPGPAFCGCFGYASYFPVFCVRSFQPFPLRDGSFYFGTAPWYFLSRCTWPRASSNELNHRVRLPAALMAARVSVRRRFQHELKREFILQPSDIPDMLIPLTSYRLIVFRQDLMIYSYRPAGENLVLQTWLMSEPFAPDFLDERIASTGRAPARHLADDPSARKQFRPARPPQCVRCWYGHGDNGPNRTFRHRSVLHGG